jgi:hypothetical protein
MIRILALYALTITTLSGCSGNLYTVLNPDLSTDAGNEKKVEGVIVYPIKNVVEVYETQALVDKNKKIVGKAPKDCTPKRSLKFSTRTDFSSPYKIVYEAGWLETNAFGVTIKDGALTGVNASSDPSKGATALASLLPFVATPHAPAFVPDGKPFCNELPKLLGVFESPRVLPYEQIPK